MDALLETGENEWFLDSTGSRVGNSTIGRGKPAPDSPGNGVTLEPR